MSASGGGRSLSRCFYWRSKSTSRSPALTMLRVVEILGNVLFFLLVREKYFKMINTILIFVLKMYSFGAHSSSAGRANVPWTEVSSSLGSSLTCGPLLSVTPPPPPFPVISSAVLSIKPWKDKKNTNSTASRRLAELRLETRETASLDPS